MTLDDLSKAMTNWRKNKIKKRERIPKELWQEAIKLGQIHGIKETAKAIGVHTIDLKKRVENPNGKVSHPG
jgi:hypothetical protein